MQALKCGYNALMSVFSVNHASTIIEFITITRGGESGLLAVLNKNLDEVPEFEGGLPVQASLF